MCRESLSKSLKKICCFYCFYSFHASVYSLWPPGGLYDKVGGGSQSSEHVLCEDETQEMCVGVKGERSSLRLSPTSSLPGPPEVGKPVSKEGMARQSDRGTSRPQVTPLSKLSA